MAEWSKAHAWKVCIPQKGILGSNPSLSAKETLPYYSVGIFISGVSKKFQNSGQGTSVGFFLRGDWLIFKLMDNSCAPPVLAFNRDIVAS